MNNQSRVDWSCPQKCTGLFSELSREPGPCPHCGAEMVQVVLDYSKLNEQTRTPDMPYSWPKYTGIDSVTHEIIETDDDGRDFITGQFLIPC